MEKRSASSLWVSVSVIGGAVVAAALALYFLSNAIDTQASQIVSDKTTAAQQTEAVSMLAHLESDAAQAAPYAAAMEQLLPTHDALIGFPQWITGIGQAHAVSASVTFQGSGVPATPTAPGSDNFSLITTGALPDIVSFMEDAEANVPGFLLSLDSFELVNNGAQYEFSVQGKVFSR